MFKKILYPVDLSHTDFTARFAIDVERIAETFNAEIEVMTVIPGFGMAIVASYFPPDTEQRARHEVERKLKEFVGNTFSRPVKIKVEQGTHWKRILRTAKKDGIDLVIMPHCDKGWTDNILVGSCAQKVAERAHCSVLLLRPGYHDACPT